MGGGIGVPKPVGRTLLAPALASMIPHIFSAQKAPYISPHFLTPVVDVQDTSPANGVGVHVQTSKATPFLRSELCGVGLGDTELHQPAEHNRGEVALTLWCEEKGGGAQLSAGGVLGDRRNTGPEWGGGGGGMTGELPSWFSSLSPKKSFSSPPTPPPRHEALPLSSYKPPSCPQGTAG